jgi:hypothetical protein
MSARTCWRHGLVSHVVALSELGTDEVQASESPAVSRSMCWSLFLPPPSRVVAEHSTAGAEPISPAETAFVSPGARLRGRWRRRRRSPREFGLRASSRTGDRLTAG